MNIKYSSLVRSSVLSLKQKASSAPCVDGIDRGVGTISTHTFENSAAKNTRHLY